MNLPRHPRDLSVKMSVPAETGPIFAMIPRKGQIEVYARDATYAALLPDQMDRDRKSLAMPPATKKLSSVGSSSPIVARVYLQPREIMGNFPLKNSNPEEILEHFHACKDSILQADQIVRELMGDFEPLLAASKGLGFPKIDGVLRAPHIENLTNRISTFFGHAKMSIQAVGDAFNSFYGLKAKTDKPVANGNFDYARDYLGRQPQPFVEYVDFLNQSKALTAMIIRARNGFEHPLPLGSNTLTITNFEIHDSKVVNPLWNFPDEKPTAIFLDLPVLLSGLVQFAEGNFVHCFLDNINIPLSVKVVPIPDTQVNRDCPILYRMELVR